MIDQSPVEDIPLETRKTPYEDESVSAQLQLISEIEDVIDPDYMEQDFILNQHTLFEEIQQSEISAGFHVDSESPSNDLLHSSEMTKIKTRDDLQHSESIQNLLIPDVPARETLKLTESFPYIVPPQMLMGGNIPLSLQNKTRDDLQHSKSIQNCPIPDVPAKKTMKLMPNRVPPRMMTGGNIPFPL